MTGVPEPFTGKQIYDMTTWWQLDMMAKLHDDDGVYEDGTFMLYVDGLDWIGANEDLRALRKVSP